MYIVWDLVALPPPRPGVLQLKIIVYTCSPSPATPRCLPAWCPPLSRDRGWALVRLFILLLEVHVMSQDCSWSKEKTVAWKVLVHTLAVCLQKCLTCSCPIWMHQHCHALVQHAATCIPSSTLCGNFCVIAWISLMHRLSSVWLNPKFPAQCTHTTKLLNAARETRNGNWWQWGTGCIPDGSVSSVSEIILHIDLMFMLTLHSVTHATPFSTAENAMPK